VTSHRTIFLLAFLFLFAFVTGVTTQANASCSAPANKIEAENCLPGNPDTEWDIDGDGDLSIQGFATDISFNVGTTANFKIKTNATAYRIDIYRIGYYSGMGARKVATIQPSANLPQSQPACVSDTTAGLEGSGLSDCGNWAVSASWQIPANAVSGVYIALLTRSDTGGQSHIIFIVRDDSSNSDLLFQTSDTTWQAYNYYGLGSLYGSNSGQFDSTSRAYKVSYNRPFLTRGRTPFNWFFESEYPMIRWLEANGYDVTYFSGVDTDRYGALIRQHRVFLSVGHDEYWSGNQRGNVEAARSAGVNLAFFSGNEVFWKTRWENSRDGSNTPFRTLVCYKETHANAKIDPSGIWTGTWRDSRFSPPADGGRPENGLTGTLFMVNGTSFHSIKVPAAYGNMRFWRNTTVAGQSVGQVATFPVGTLGFEWDIANADNGARPAGLFYLSSATYDISGLFLLDNGSNYGNGTATHNLTMYRDPSGALVFGSGTIQWSWGLDSEHDATFLQPFPADIRMQQATVNLFADMGVQPATLQGGLVRANASTDSTPPNSTVTSPAAGSEVNAGETVTISGTASDPGGVVGGIEVSVDGGTTWRPATGRESWTYDWIPPASGTINIKTRAVDDSGNLEVPGAGITVSVAPRQCPCSVWSTATPAVVDSGDGSPIEVGVRFRSEVSGVITGLRFYKSSRNTGTHVAHLWTNGGSLLATATFSNETASGWQEVSFPFAVPIKANTTYVASYFAPNGHYSVDPDYFASASVDNPPLHFLRDGIDGANGVFRYSPAGGFPNSTFRASNYWVDVVFTAGGAAGPTVTSISPASGATSVSSTTQVTATFDKALNSATVTSSTFRLLDPDNTPVPATVTYDAASFTATLSPSSALAPVTTYTAVISGGANGVKDTSGNPLPSDVAWSFTACCSLWDPTTVPQTIDSGETNPVELGVRFRSDVNGYVAGVRFYKASTNTGTHVAHLWTNNGTLLAFANFASETASGWQQVMFPAAVAVKANTTYVVSYFAPNGHYSVDSGYFATAGVDSPPLHLLRDGLDGANGIFKYSSTPAFPTSTFNSSNYWVEPIFVADDGSGSGLTLVTKSPEAGATGVGTASTVRATFNKALDVATVTNSTFRLLDDANNLVEAAVTYNASTSSATLTPASALSPASSYTAVITGGVSGIKDTSGQSLPLSISWSFNTCCSGWTTSSTPTDIDAGDANPGEYGVRFRSDVDGFITSLRFYKSPANTGTHVGHIWTNSGTLMASAVFTSESGSGWQQVTFPSPVAISANTTYVASYYTPTGHYSADDFYFASGGLDNPPLHFLGDGVDGANGVFSYGSSSTFPSSTFKSRNYWVDVVFVTDAGTVSGPVVTLTSPASAATGVSTGSKITATFNKALDPTTVTTSTFRLFNPSNTAVLASVTYDANTLTATLTPTNALNFSTTYRASISGGLNGVKDVSGNPLASNVSWSFTTAAACPCSIWSPTTVPPTIDSADATAGEYGVRFRSDVDGVITGIKFYKSAANTGPHIANLWSNTGNLLATATFVNESASGWQEAQFDTPVAITANTTYVASYYSASGHYSLATNVFQNRSVNNAPLHAIQDGSDGANGVYLYSSTSGFPTSTFQASNYWVDVVFNLPGAVTLASVEVDPTTVVGGTNATGTVTLTAQAPSGGATIALSSSDSSAQVLASVTVPAGATIATFTVTTTGVSSSTPVTITATYGTARTAPLTVTPPALSLASITVNPISVVGGNSSTGTVTLSGPAPTGGATVTLASNNTAAQVPASVVVPAAATSATFTVTTSAVSSSTPATITAAFGAAQSATLTVTPPALTLSSVTLNPTTVVGGNSSTGTVTLSGPAPTGGITVTLSSNNTAAQVPASVVVPAAATSATFTVTTSVVSSSTPVTITATFGGSRTAALTVNPVPTAPLQSLTVSPTAVTGGNTSTGTVQLTTAAPAGGAAVVLTSSNTALATVPATVIIAAGTTSATFPISTTPVASDVAVVITAASGTTRTANLTVRAPTLSSVTRSSSSVVGGNSLTGTVTLNGAAPAGGISVTLQSGNTSAAQVPGAVSVAAGATTATFSISTNGVAVSTSVTITGVLTTTRSTSFSVTPASLTSSSLVLNPTTVTGGSSSIGTITLNGAAPPSGAVIALASSNTAVAQVPTTVTIPFNTRSVSFTITTSPVRNTSSRISATYRNTTRSVRLTVQ